MRARSVVAIIAVLIALVTLYNLAFNGFEAFHSGDFLPSRFELEREQLLRIPFHQRRHRLERRPRLERDDGIIRPVRHRDGLASVPTAADERNPTEIEDAAPQYHVLVTVDGGVYNAWQARICYYWYKRAKAEDKHGAMGGFTRILHSGKADKLMEEIPTVVVDPLPPRAHRGYVVLSRPFAFLQWYRNYSRTIEEDYIFMAEPDHIFLEAPPLWATPLMGAAFPFSYMNPYKERHILNKYKPDNVSINNFFPIGNSPVMLHLDLFGAIVGPWLNISLRMKEDPEADKAFGWILEMYAFEVASAAAPGGPIPYDIRRVLAVQPPFDTHLKWANQPVYIIHYTYGCDYDKNGMLRYGKAQRGGYRFDKRDYTPVYPPRRLPIPPDNIQDGGVVKKLIAMLNEAMEHLEPWP